MSGWRYRCSAVANRSALQSDYYSGKKITVTPLNFVCRRHRSRPPPGENYAHGSDTARKQSALPEFAREFLHITEVPMESRFSRCRVAVRTSNASMSATSLQARVWLRRYSNRRLPRREKNCAPDALSGRSTGPLSAQNARISGRPIRKNSPAPRTTAVPRPPRARRAPSFGGSRQTGVESPIGSTMRRLNGLRQSFAGFRHAARCPTSWCRRPRCAGRDAACRTKVS